MTDQTDITFDLFHQFDSECSNWGRWGGHDQRGTLNLITPDVITHAASLVRSGNVISFQLPLDGAGPQTCAFGRMNPKHQMVATSTDHLAGVQTDGCDSFRWVLVDDSLFLRGRTQWDALGHIFHDDVTFNGFGAGEVTSTGAKKGGVDYLPTDVSRGIVLDISQVKGVTHLEPGEAIYPEDLDEACQQLGMEVRPNEVEGTFQPLYLVFLVSMGLTVGEIWGLDSLAADCAADGQSESMFVRPPLHIPGVVGSPLNPQVIK